jgi:elongation of very long chain fatty acids protein 7
MAHLVTSVVDHYQDLLDNKSDPRVKGWAMMSSPVPTLLICLFYAYFSTVLGPKLMENRKPFNLRKILIFYNCVQTLFSAWICYEYLMSGWWGSYSFRCQPVDYSDSPMALRVSTNEFFNAKRDKNTKQFNSIEIT